MGNVTGWLTKYGFTFGPAVVTRHASIERRPGKGHYVIIGIDTGPVNAPSVVPDTDGPEGFAEPDAHIEPACVKHTLHVYISPTGRSVRCYLDGEELLTSAGHRRVWRTGR
jgi:hypothetical protein